MKNTIILVFIMLSLGTVLHCQDNGYNFVMIKEVPSTPVKDQSLTSTCWSFSGISFFESEIMRKGKKAYDLSEMFIVREAYEKKAEAYATRNGECVFSGGGQYDDLLKITREYGLVPDDVYPGLNYGTKNHNHDEMDAALKGYMRGVVKSPRHTPAWHQGLVGILEAYLGKVTPGFTYEGEYYTPKDFAGHLGLNFDDYIVLSSFGDRPFYKESVLQVPDNWAPCSYYNLPLDELIGVIDNCLMNGYSVAWASDMRGKGFSMKKGVAIVPEKNWDSMNEVETQEEFEYPHAEKNITQEVRQKEFENWEINGDHGMHIIGMAQDQNGDIFYKVKNSWGETGKYKGYIYVSKEFVKLKTTNIMINKNALPMQTAQKMGIEIDQYQNGAIAEGSENDKAGRGTVQNPQGMTTSPAVPLAN